MPPDGGECLRSDLGLAGATLAELVGLHRSAEQ